jgi:hypothetical protein
VGDILPRLVALVVGIGDLILGALSLGFFLSTSGAAWTLPLLMFGPGSLVIFGCFVRAVHSPRLRIRRALWVLSILVHCGCLLITFINHVGQGIPGKPYGPPVVMGWWVIAVIASIIALSLETDSW